MGLTVGQKLGPYEIESPAGAGGMGEVYKARDTRLDRTVAIKVLPEKTAQDPSLRARFEREAKAISSLNHPHICTLHDIGHENGIDYLVMEYIEGETLSDRLKRGPMDIPEALGIAIEAADALDSAHRQGLIHRDLKPGNIMLTKDGAKLLDFGLAKTQVGLGGDASLSAITQTTPLTGAGTLIGTIQYMAPEQLEGSEAEKRSDIFAFGVVLYEMIAGQPAFAGKSQASLIAAIIERTPTPIATLKPLAPPGLDRLIQKCLAKDPDARWQSIRDLADELRWIAQSGSQAGISAPLSAKRKFRFRLAWAVATLALLSTGILAFVMFTQPEAPDRVRRFSVTPQPGLEDMSWPFISPDGRQLAFLGIDTIGVRSIWIRSLNSLESHRLPGTEGAGRPFWSPDSRYLGFNQNSKQIKKILVSGGPAQLVGELNGVADGTWGSAGEMLFDNGMGDTLFQISASGGVCRPAPGLYETGASHSRYGWPWFLPDGKSFLFLNMGDTAGGGSSGGSYGLMVGSIESGEVRRLTATDSRVAYSRDGYLLYVLDNVLLAQEFDEHSWELLSEPIPIAENVPVQVSNGRAGFSVSDEGTLVFDQDASGSLSELYWVDRNGRVIEKIGEASEFKDIALSPDENSVAYALGNANDKTRNIYIHDLNRGISSRLTFGGGLAYNPLWSGDSKKICYTYGSIQSFTVWSKPADGSASAVALFDSTSSRGLLNDISKDGNVLAYVSVSPRISVVLHFLDDVDSSIAVADNEFWEYGIKISPNGRFVAYTSMESGRGEIYIRQVDGSGGKWQVSKDAGEQPLWRADGKEFYYLAGGRKLMAVKVDIENNLVIGKAVELFEKDFLTGFLISSAYQPSSDGQKFLVNLQVGKNEERGFVVVQDWYKELLKK